MKRLAAITLAVLVIALGVCIASRWTLGHVLDQASALNEEILARAERENAASASETLSKLTKYWSEKQTILGTFCERDALREVTTLLIEARISLDNDDAEDFYTSLSLVSESLAHIRFES